MKEWVKKRDPILSRYPWKWLLYLRHAPNKETSYGKCQAYLMESLSVKAQWNLSLLTSLITEENLKGELKRNSLSREDRGRWAWLRTWLTLRLVTESADERSSLFYNSDSSFTAWSRIASSLRVLGIPFQAFSSHPNVTAKRTWLTSINSTTFHPSCDSFRLRGCESSVLSS